MIAALSSPFIFEVKERSEVEAMWSLAWLAHRAGRLPRIGAVQLPAGEPGVMAGLATAWIWDGRDILSSEATATIRKAEGAAQQAFDLRDQAALALHAANGSREEISSLVDQGKKSTAEAGRNFAEFEVTLTDRLNDTVKFHGSELESKWQTLARTYEESLKLQAPAKYWSDKRSSHNKQALIFTGLSILAAVIGGHLLVKFYEDSLGKAASNTIPTWGALLPAIVAGVLFLWLLRTLMRLTMSHVHLSLDAAERHTMITCYLAMTKEGETSGEERSALFAAIFRATGDGIVKDESPPIPLWEMLKAGKAP